MINVLPIEGMDAYWAVQAYIKLMLGLKMLPAYGNETYEEFFGRVEKMPVADRRLLVREATNFVTLDEDEILALIRFATDPNGVPYGKENTKKMPVAKILDLIHAVAFEIAMIEIKFVSDSEKKN